MCYRPQIAVLCVFVFSALSSHPSTAWAKPAPSPAMQPVEPYREATQAMADAHLLVRQGNRLRRNKHAKSRDPVVLKAYQGAISDLIRRRDQALRRVQASSFTKLQVKVLMRALSGTPFQELTTRQLEVTPALPSPFGVALGKELPKSFQSQHSCTFVERSPLFLACETAPKPVSGMKRLLVKSDKTGRVMRVSGVWLSEKDPAGTNATIRFKRLQKLIIDKWGATTSRYDRVDRGYDSGTTYYFALKTNHAARLSIWARPRFVIGLSLVAAKRHDTIGTRLTYEDRALVEQEKADRAAADAEAL